jgi:hypothetical protein
MNHLNEEQLVLHYYGEDSSSEGISALAAEQHLDACETCRDAYGSLQRVLNVVDSLPVPGRSPDYGAEVWRAIEHRLPRRSWMPRLPALGLRWAAAGAAFASLMVLAFMAGRGSLSSGPRMQRPPVQLAALDSPSGEGVLLVAVADYLERSQMVLIELANANPKGSMDITSERDRAAGLVSESRLYQQTAAHTGDATVANVLEELDRVLLDIAHGPSEVTPAELEKLRERLEAQGILFKIRVLGSNVRTQVDPVPSGDRRKL